jgi:hypothetical protein
MKKATNRVLTALLALCLLLGCSLSASAAAKSFGATLTISKMPTDTTFIPNITEPDLSGLVLKFKLGGVEKTLRYDDMWDDYYFYKSEQDSFNIWLEYPDKEVKVGKNTFYLQVSVNSGNEGYTRSRLPITLTGVSLLDKVDPAQIETLTAGLPNLVEPVDVYYGNDLKLYAFTPKVNGTYVFRSFFSNRLKIPSLYDIADAYTWYGLNLSYYTELFLEQNDPYGRLFDADGQLVAEGDDQGVYITNYDFRFTAQLEAGKTYYFLPSSYGSDTSYVVTATFLSFTF